MHAKIDIPWVWDFVGYSQQATTFRRQLRPSTSHHADPPAVMGGLDRRRLFAKRRGSTWRRKDESYTHVVLV